jgi:hypothetical protein
MVRVIATGALLAAAGASGFERMRLSEPVEDVEAMAILLNDEVAGKCRRKDPSAESATDPAVRAIES